VGGGVGHIGSRARGAEVKPHEIARLQHTGPVGRHVRAEPDPAVAANGNGHGANDEPPTDVLLVSADGAVLEQLTLLLDQPGWEDGRFVVRAVATCTEGTLELRRRRPDAVVLDLGSSGQRNLDDLVRLVAVDHTLPVIVMTSQAEAVHGRDALMHGAQDFLVKETMTSEQVVRSLRYAISRAATAAEAEATERRFRSLVSRISDVVTVVDESGNVLYISPSAPRLLGTESTARLLERGLMGYIHPDDLAAANDAWQAWQAGQPAVLECRIVGRNGRTMYSESVGVNLTDDPAVGGIVITTRDITDRKRAQDHLSYQARHDSLTGLPNRAMMLEELAVGLRRSQARGSGAALLFVDIDHFKLINDHHGHRTGDEVLAEIGGVLAETVRPGDVVGRLGGDEFAVICHGVTDRSSAVSVAGRLVQAMSRPFLVRERTFRLAVSVGVALSNANSTADGLLSEADVALHHAKERGRGRVEVFDETLRARRTEELRLEDDLRFAAEDGQFRVHYQPLIEISTGRLTGFEALVRWQHPTLGLLQPASFIEIAERTYQIGHIGEWVLGQACRQLAAWNAASPGLDLSVAVNLSAQQLADEHLPQVAGSVLHETGLLPANLCFEITESVAMQDAAASVRSLHALRSLGVKLAIDDFGTGYSSLAYLRRLPVDHVKIDRSFVAGLGRDAEDRVVVDSIIHLAERLGLEVVAEGVETDTQMAELVDLGCRYAQGYLWGRPAPAAEAGDFIDAARSGALARPLPPRPEGYPAHAAPPAPETTSSAVRARQEEETLSLVARQMRWPARSITSAAQAVARHVGAGEPDEAVHALETIARQAARVEALADALTDVSAIEEGALALHPRSVELSGLLRLVADQLEPVLAQHEVKLSGPPVVQLYADPVRLGRALANLLDNAAAFSPPGAPITVSLRERDDAVSVHVVDRGPGVAADRVAWLFRRLPPSPLPTDYLDPTAPEQVGVEGSGLGLYLARGYARAHGGDLRYHRAEGAGAEFILTMPKVPVSGGDDPVPAEGLSLDEEVFGGWGGRRRAITQFDPALREDKEALGALVAAGRNLLRASSPEEAVGAGIDLVHDLGGHVMPARIAPAHALAFDLSCGEGEELRALAEPTSPVRQRLERALPPFLDDVARMIESLRHSDGAAVATGPTEEPTDDVLGQLDEGDLVLALRLVPENQQAEGDRVLDVAMPSLQRMLRTQLRATDTCVPWSEKELAVVLRGTSAEESTSVLERLRGHWTDWRPAPTRLEAIVEPVTAGAGAEAVETALAALDARLAVLGSGIERAGVERATLEQHENGGSPR